MKNNAIATTLALSLLFGSVPVFADGSSAPTASTYSLTTTVSQSYGDVVEPDSLLYSLKELLHEIKLLLTFNETEKADLLIKQANDKISELEALKANGTNQYNEEYSIEINEILKETDQVLKTASSQLEKEDKETQEKDKQEIEKKQMALIEVQKHSLTVLKANLEKVPEQGKKGIRNAIARQEAKLKVETTTASDETNVVQTTTDQNRNVLQSEIVQSPAQPTHSTKTTTSITVQAKPEKAKPQQGVDKGKQNNGLHLGQKKNEGQKEKQKPNQK